ncbi:NfeD family protein [Nitrospinota bacterium]
MFPLQEASGLYALVNGPFLILAWLVWRVHKRQPMTGKEGMVGRRAVTTTALDPEGWVRCGSELWFARSRDHVAAGEIVRVLSVEKLQLSVIPVRGKNKPLSEVRFKMF